MAHRGLVGVGGLRVEGGAVRASLHHEAKPDVIKGLFRKRGGCDEGCWSYSRSSLRESRDARSRLACSPGGSYGAAREGIARRGEVSRGQSTGGVADRREGPNAKPRCRTFVLVVVALIAANLCGGLGERV